MRLTWDASTSAGVAGYRLYHGTTSAVNGDVVPVGIATSADYQTTVAGTHYFAVAAVAADGTESPRSDPIAVTVQ